MLENVVLTSIVMALTQVAKGFIESRFVPLVALALGVVGSIGLHIGTGDLNLANHIIEGVISGLVAVGLYSSTKNTMK